MFHALFNLIQYGAIAGSDISVLLLSAILIY